MQTLRDLAALFKLRETPLYIVGGCIRDKLVLNHAVFDIDITSALTPAQVENLLGGSEFSITKSNPKLGYLQITNGIQRWDYTTFRKDTYKKSGNYFHVKIKFVKSIRQDAKRRDFTINAIYCDILTGKLRFFFGAKRHMRKRIMHTCKKPGRSFREDALRIPRLVRFCSKLYFSPSQKTFEAAYKYKHLMQNIPDAYLEREIAKFPPEAKSSGLHKLLMTEITDK